MDIQLRVSKASANMAISREKLEDYEITLEFNTELLAGI